MCFAGLPQCTHTSPSFSCANGIHLVVAPVSSLMAVSQASSPHHIALMNPCFFSRISVNSSQFVATCVFASRCAFAFAYISSCICASNASQVSASLSNGTIVFSLVSRRTTTACPASISFGPTSTRSGIPLLPALRT